MACSPKTRFSRVQPYPSRPRRSRAGIAIKHGAVLNPLAVLGRRPDGAAARVGLPGAWARSHSQRVTFDVEGFLEEYGTRDVRLPRVGAVAGEVIADRQGVDQIGGRGDLLARLLTARAS